MVGHRSLEPVMMVRIHLLQPNSAKASLILRMRLNKEHPKDLYRLKSINFVLQRLQSFCSSDCLTALQDEICFTNFARVVELADTYV